MARDLSLLPAEYFPSADPSPARRSDGLTLLTIGPAGRVEGGRGRDPARSAEVPEPADARSVLLDALSHELRTALALVSGYSQTLLHLDLEETDRGRYLARISAASAQVAELSEEMLAIAAAPDQAAPHCQPVAIGNLVSRVGRSLASEGQAPALAVRLPLDLPLVRADPIWVGRVLRALVMDAARNAGEVSLEAEATTDAVVVTIARADEDATEPASPAESCLHLCRELVEAHGGRVWREPPGPVAAVSFSLPRYRPLGRSALPAGVRRPLRAGFPAEA